MSIPDSLEFVLVYFSSTITLGILLATCGAALVLVALFRLNRDNPNFRVRLLYPIFAIVTFNWGFLASSLLFCQALLGLYLRIGDTAVFPALGLALLTSLIFAIPFSALLVLFVPWVMMTRLQGQLFEADAKAVEALEKNAMRLGLWRVRIAQTLGAEPFAYSIARGNLVVVSRGIVSLLDGDELESVVAHELGHFKEGGDGLRMLLAVYRRVLFFDPLLSALERALHREREFSADEFAARVTLKPLPLASALLRIYVAASKNHAAPPLAHALAGGSRSKGKGPNPEDRIKRLLQLASILEARPDRPIHDSRLKWAPESRRRHLHRLLPKLPR